MSPISVASGKVDPRHFLVWELADREWDTTVRFKLRCRLCGGVFGEVGFDWIGTDGPPLGSVIRELSKRKTEAENRHAEDCPRDPLHA